MPLRHSKYSIIYADPPWHYEQGESMGTSFQGAADAQYPTMSIEDIKMMPIAGLADDPSVLFLWATFPQLDKALEVIKAWGFEYKTLGFSWLKLNNSGTPFFGIGYYAKSNMEICLLGTRGKAHSLLKSNSVSSVVITERLRHSEKPAIIRDRIVEMFGDLPRLELFARTETPGWDCWGNEVD